ncbi:MAG: twin transmembrane helix small protein, partial [Limnobacter sp.]|nr:twin transmembrane helix small protein [Limnobacter sp.]
MKTAVGIAFLFILGSLAFAFVFLMKNKSQSKRMANALTVRIGLSVLLFLLILLAGWMGWIHPTASTECSRATSVCIKPPQCEFWPSA